MPRQWPVDRDRIAADLADLVSIPSGGGTAGEVAAQDHLADSWRAEGWQVDTWDIEIPALVGVPGFPGMEVERSAARGVLACWRGTGGGRTLLLNGHTDVVPPGERSAWRNDPFAPALRHTPAGVRMYGRGTCDMKGGLVAAWEAVRAIRASGVRLRGDVLLAPVVAEEDGGAGAFALLQRGVRADACIICEPTGLDIIPANAGALTFRLRIPGRSAHASRRYEGVSAVEKLQPVLAALSELERRRNASVEPLMARWPIAYPLSIGSVRAGEWASTVPDLLVAEGRLGVALRERVTDAREEFGQAVALACRADPWLAEHPVAVQWWGGQFAPAATRLTSSPIPELAAAHAAQTGRPAEVYGAPFGSDLRLFVGAGIPTVLYGPGDSAVAHASDEWVAIDDIVTCAQVLADVIVQVCG